MPETRHRSLSRIEFGDHAPLHGWGTIAKGLRLAELVLETQARCRSRCGVFGGRGVHPDGHRPPIPRQGICGRGIDAWEVRDVGVEGGPSAENDAWWAKIDHDEIYAHFIRALVRRRGPERCRVMRERSDTALRLFEDAAFRSCSQDGNHSEQVSVRRSRSGARSADRAATGSPTTPIGRPPRRRGPALLARRLRARRRITPPGAYTASRERAAGWRQRRVRDTSRDAAFRLVCDSLAAQSDNGDVDVIFVDGLHDPNAVGDCRRPSPTFPFRHVPPKPTPYNGPFANLPRFLRRGQRAQHRHRPRDPALRRVRRRCLGRDAGWWARCGQAARNGHVVAGAYQKHWEMMSSTACSQRSRVEPSGVDSRWAQGDDRRSVRIRARSCSAPASARRATCCSRSTASTSCAIPSAARTGSSGARMEFAGAAIRYARTHADGRKRGTAPGRGQSMERIDRLADPERYGFEGWSTSACRAASSKVLGTAPTCCWTSPTACARPNPWGTTISCPTSASRTSPTRCRRFPARHWFDGRRWTSS